MAIYCYEPEVIFYKAILSKAFEDFKGSKGYWYFLEIRDLTLIYLPCNCLETEDKRSANEINS